ncbi:MAG: hypothetical protein LBM59_05180 [Ruminococcus sp.]|jgi:competence protein ComFC|nr:hypothetical protein [Ruminococcus sp.]
MTVDHKLNDFFLDIIFPNRCPCCDCFIPWNITVCEDCEAKLSEYKALSGGIISAYLYKGIVVDGIYALKAAYGRNFARHCAKITSPLLKKDYDFIVPVPMGKKQRAARGYNQAEIFAGYLSRFTSIPVMKNALIRVSDKKQHLLSAHDRKINAEASYSGGLGDIDGKRIYLADDVCTTGATISACTNLLYAAGAKNVKAVVCAKTNRI